MSGGKSTYISYDKNDFPTFCTEDAHEMARFLGITLESMYSYASKCNRGEMPKKRIKVFSFKSHDLDEVTI